MELLHMLQNNKTTWKLIQWREYDTKVLNYLVIVSAVSSRTHFIVTKRRRQRKCDLFATNLLFLYDGSFSSETRKIPETHLICFRDISFTGNIVRPCENPSQFPNDSLPCHLNVHVLMIWFQHIFAECFMQYKSCSGSCIFHSIFGQFRCRNNNLRCKCVGPEMS
jgi:hypothetical protein